MTCGHSRTRIAWIVVYYKPAGACEVRKKASVGSVIQTLAFSGSIKIPGVFYLAFSAALVELGIVNSLFPLPFFPNPPPLYFFK